MHGLGTRLLAGEQDQLGLEIALGGGGRAQPHRLVRLLDMRRARVGIRIDRDRLDAHGPRGADDATGDLAAIGDQDFLEQPIPPSLR